jgi:hypothetical protein
MAKSLTSPKRDDAPPKTGRAARFHGKTRGPSPHNQRKVARVVRAAKAGGALRVELTPDGFNIILAETAPQQTITPEQIIEQL